jgi:hypothetical protein
LALWGKGVSRVDGKLDPSDGVASAEGPARHALLSDTRLLFGLVTFMCLVVALTLSAYGHRPALMLPVAIACAIVFVRHGDGRAHWTPATVTEPRNRTRRDR